MEVWKLSQNNRDFSVQSFWAACVASGIGYLVIAGVMGVPRDATRYILIYLLSLAAFIGYLWHRRSKAGTDVKMNGEDFFSALMASAVAQWVAVVLMFVFEIFGNNVDVHTNGNQSAYYQNCSDARAHGVSRIHRGEPGYRAALDRDGDGVACE